MEKAALDGKLGTLLTGLKDADMKATDELRAIIFSYVKKKVRNFHDAEEVTSDTLWALYEAELREYAPSYLVFHLAKIKVIDRLKHSHCEKRDVDKEECSLDDSLNRIANDLNTTYGNDRNVQETIDFWDSVEKLPELQRQIFTLKFYGHTLKDISLMLTMHPSNVRREFVKAKNAMQTSMGL